MSLESLKKRIKTTEDLRNIVSTMKTLSSVSILQYDQAMLSLRGYKKNIRDAFHALIKRGSLPFMNRENKSGKTLSILVGTDTGLVGRFNQEILERAVKENKETLCIPVGKRMVSFCENARLNISAKYAISNSVKVVNSLAETLIVKIYETMKTEKISSVNVFFHTRESATPVYIEKLTLLPFSKSVYEKLHQKKWKTNQVPLITLSSERMIETLIKEYLMIELCLALTSSLACEHYTRMINMQNAEKNIDENLRYLNHEYQQKRQTEITEELIDVVSGAEALKK